MPAYSPDFTARLKVTYTALGTVYTNTWRYDHISQVAEGVAESLALSFYTPLMSLMPSDFGVISVESAEPAVAFFLPVTSPELAALEGTNVTAVAGNREYRAVGLQFQAKTFIGNPWRITLQGVIGVDPFTGAADTSDNFRFEFGELAAVDSALTGLAALFAGGGLVGNDGRAALVKQYANVVVSRYRINRIRRFG